jgi:hypothetical protein
MKRVQRKTIDLIVTALLARDEAGVFDIFNRAEGTAERFFAQRAYVIQDQLRGAGIKACRARTRRPREPNGSCIFQMRFRP